MTIHLQKTIRAKDGTDFYKQIAALSFEGFIKHGVGAVVIQEGAFQKHTDGRVEADVLYVPYSVEDGLLPPETVAMIDAYKPELDVVLAIVGNDGMADCLTFSAERIGCTPATAYARSKESNADIEPGSVWRLKESIGDIGAGTYVFLREEKAVMRLARAGMDVEDGTVVATDEEVAIHVDYRDAFESLGMNVYYGTG